MLKPNQLIEISWGNINKEWYVSKGYKFTKIRDKLLVKAEDLSPKSNKKVIVICDYCNDESVKSFCDYTVSKESVVNKDACRKCKVLKTKDSLMMNHGVSHQSQLNWVIEKIREKEKLPIQDVIDAFSDRNCELITKDYVNAKFKLEYKCLFHPEEIQVNSLDGFKTSKYNCEKCRLDSNLIKLHDKYKSILSEKGIELVNSSRDCEDNVIFEVKCLKHEFSRTIPMKAVNYQTYICLNCVKENISIKRRHELSYVESKFKDKGYELLNLDSYKNNTTELIYICSYHLELGIQKTNFANINNNVTCPKCNYIRISGDNHYLWKGGISPLHNYMRDKIERWKKESLKQHLYKCFISGDKGDLVVHHIVNYADVLDETLRELNLEVRKRINEYSEDELKSIETLLIDKHFEYGLGLPLRRDIHEKFHSIYGRKNNTYEQILEFKNKYINGEIEGV